MPTAHAPSRHVLRKQTRAISTALLARANVLPAYLEDGPTCGLVAVERRGEQDALVAVAGVLAALIRAAELDADALRVLQALVAAHLQRLFDPGTRPCATRCHSTCAVNPPFAP